jgi:hypothetical protein
LGTETGGGAGLVVGDPEFEAISGFCTSAQILPLSERFSLSHDSPEKRFLATKSVEISANNTAHKNRRAIFLFCFFFPPTFTKSDASAWTSRC